MHKNKLQKKSNEGQVAISRIPSSFLRRHQCYHKTLELHLMLHLTCSYVNTRGTAALFFIALYYPCVFMSLFNYFVIDKASLSCFNLVISKRWQLQA